MSRSEPKRETDLARDFVAVGVFGDGIYSVHGKIKEIENLIEGYQNTPPYFLLAETSNHIFVKIGACHHRVARRGGRAALWSYQR